MKLNEPHETIEAAAKAAFKHVKDGVENFGAIFKIGNAFFFTTPRQRDVNIQRGAVEVPKGSLVAVYQYLPKKAAVSLSHRPLFQKVGSGKIVKYVKG